MKRILIASTVAVLAVAVLASAATFNVNLTVGSRGADVTALQTALIAAGYSIPAGATGYFGSQTQAAVKLYQAAKGIPNTGFVGPLTRAALNGAPVATVPGTVVCPVGYDCVPKTGTTPVIGTVGGSEGLFKNINASGDIDTDLKEGDKNVKVLGVEFDADESDMTITRVDVVMENTASSTSSYRIERYFTNIALWLDGKKIASAPVSAGERDGSVYTFRVTGLSGVVKENATAQMFVALDAVANVDSDDTTAEWSVTIPAAGVRAVDTAGISDTYFTSAYDSTGVTVNSATVGDLDLAKASSNPDADDIEVSDTDDTTVTALVANLEANGQAITVTEIPVTLTTTNASTSAIVRNLKLYQGSTLLKTKTVTSAASSVDVVFNDLDIDIAKDSKVTLTVKATVKPIESDSTNFTQGDSFNVAIDGAAVLAEDANGEDASTSGDANGEEMTLRTEGLALTLVSVNEEKENGAGGSVDDIGTYTIVFDAKAFGGEDVYIGATSTEDASPTASAGAGVTYSVTNDGSNATNAILTAAGSESEDNTALYFIPSGDTRRFTLQVTVTPSADAYAVVQLTGVEWGNSNDAITQLYTSNLDNYKTDPLYLINR